MTDSLINLIWDLRELAFEGFSRGWDNLDQRDKHAEIDRVINRIKEVLEQSKKLTFGELTAGDHFIAWPIPGDNAGHGGYRGSTRLFVRTLFDEAKDGRGVTSHFPTEMPVIRVSLG